MELIKQAKTIKRIYTYSMFKGFYLFFLKKNCSNCYFTTTNKYEWEVNKKSTWNIYSMYNVLVQWEKDEIVESCNDACNKKKIPVELEADI